MNSLSALSFSSKSTISSSSSSSFSSSSSSTASTSASEQSEINWRALAQADLSSNTLYISARTAVQTAIRIIGKPLKNEIDEAEYLAVQCMSFYPDGSISQFFRSFCNEEEASLIDANYAAAFCDGKADSLCKINYFKMRPDEVTAPKLFHLLPRSQITFLDLSRYRIDDKSIESLSQFLPQTKITHLILSNCIIDSNGLQILSSVLPKTQITYLALKGDFSLAQGSGGRVLMFDIGHNFLDKRIQPLLNVLSKTQLRSLNLEDNVMGERGMAHLALELSKTNITSLNLRRNVGGDKGIQCLSEALLGTHVTQLDLGDNRCGVVGIKSLSSVLTQTHITKLELRGNKIDDEGIAHLARVLARAPIISLGLAWNFIGSKGAQSLAKGLSGSRISNLNLSNNMIEDNGVESIASLLPQTSITSLNLCSVYMRNKGMQSLSKVLDKTRITYLDVTYNKIGDTGVESLSASLAKTEIVILWLSGFPIGEKSVSKLAQILPKTRIKKFSINTRSEKASHDLMEAAAEMRSQGRKIRIEIVGLAKEEIAKLESAKRQAIKEAAEKAQKEAAEKTQQEAMVKDVQTVFKFLKLLEKNEKKENSLSKEWVQKKEEELLKMENALQAAKEGFKNTEPIEKIRRIIESAKSKCWDYDPLYLEAYAVVQTAFDLLEKKEKMEDSPWLYETILWLQKRNEDFSLFEIFESFCSEMEMQGIKRGYDAFYKGQSDRDKISYFRNSEEKNRSYQPTLNLQQLIQILPQSKIKYLNLRACGIDSEGIFLLANKLPSTITGLHLGYNTIGSAGISSLARVLPQTHIQSLNLSNNRIDAQGIQALSSALTHTPTITYLDLWGNSIGVEGIRSLISVLPQTQITHLNLWGTGINTNAIQGLSSILAQTQISHLNLGGNFIDDKSAECLAAVLEKTAIITLNLSVNTIQKTGTNSLLKASASLQAKGKAITIVGVPGISKETIAKTCDATEKPSRNILKATSTFSNSSSSTSSASSSSPGSDTEKSIVERLQEQSRENLLSIEALAAKEKELADLQEQLKTAQGPTLQLLQTNARELEQLIKKQQELQIEESEKKRICSHAALHDYYHTFLILFTDTLSACKPIHAKVGPAQTPNSKMYIDDYINKGVRTIGQAIPGVNFATSVLTESYSQASQRSKLIEINPILQFLPIITDGDIWAKTIARKLTLAQETRLKAIPSQETGFIRRTMAICKDAKCWLTADDVNNPIRRLAKEQCEALLNHIIKGSFRCPASLQDIPTIVVILLGKTTTGLSTSTLVQPSIPASSSSTTLISTTSCPTTTALEVQIKQLEDKVKAAEDKAIKADRKAEKTKQVVEASGISSAISIGATSSQVYVSANTNPGATSLESMSRLERIERQLAEITITVATIVEERSILLPPLKLPESSARKELFEKTA